MRITRITLESLSERIQPGDASNLASQLPEEIARHLTKVDSVEQFEWDGFVDRVIEGGGYNRDDQEGDAVHHARAVVSVLYEAVGEDAMADVRDGLPQDDEWDELFVYADQDEPPVPEEQRPE